MNAFPTRIEYERDVLKTFARIRSKPLPALSDEDVSGERKAQAMFFEALGEFVSKVQDVQALTDIRKEEMGELLSRLVDLTPNPLAWSEAISDARRGY